MKLTHEFTVPASVEETWSAFNDIESVAGCFPGATVTEVDGDSFTGSCKVKLGPIALVYKGSGSFTEKDESARVMKIKALGKDKRGNGTAGADVSATMAEVGPNQTRVEVVTDLNITGKPAQFGRGVMQDVSDKLLAQFVECLKSKVGSETEAEPEAPAASVGAGEQPTLPAQSTVDPADSASTGTAVSGASAATPRTATPRASQASGTDDALDLGATVVPILLKTYGKQLAAAVGVLLLITWITRRRRTPDCCCGK